MRCFDWKSFFTILLLCFSITLKGQISIGVTIGGLAIHQGKTNPDFYPWKLDKKGYAVVFGGVNLSLSYRINDYIGIKAVQSLIFHDSGGKFAGISHIGIQFHDDIAGMRSVDHHLSMSIGPFWYYRKNWTNIDGYKNDPEFINLSENGVWERKFVWYGGFMQYAYSLDESNDFAIDLLPGYPHIYALTAGWNKRL